MSGSDSEAMPPEQDLLTRDVLTDWAWRLQDQLVGEESDWLASLPLSDAVRDEIYKHLCRITGRLIDAFVAAAGPGFTPPP